MYMYIYIKFEIGTNFYHWIYTPNFIHLYIRKL